MAEKAIDLASLMAVYLHEPLGQLRAVPVQLKVGRPAALLLVHSACAGDDPYHEMYFFPATHSVASEGAPGRPDDGCPLSGGRTGIWTSLHHWPPCRARGYSKG